MSKHPDVFTVHLDETEGEAFPSAPFGTTPIPDPNEVVRQFQRDYEDNRQRVRERDKWVINQLAWAVIDGLGGEKGESVVQKIFGEADLRWPAAGRSAVDTACATAPLSVADAWPSRKLEKVAPERVVPLQFAHVWDKDGQCVQGIGLVAVGPHRSGFVPDVVVADVGDLFALRIDHGDDRDSNVELDRAEARWLLDQIVAFLRKDPP